MLLRGSVKIHMAAVETTPLTTPKGAWQAAEAPDAAAPDAAADLDCYRSCGTIGSALSASTSRAARLLLLFAVLSLVLAIVELVCALASNSLTLLIDAMTMAADSSTYALNFVAEVSQRHRRFWTNLAVVWSFLVLIIVGVVTGVVAISRADVERDKVTPLAPPIAPPPAPALAPAWPTYSDSYLSRLERGYGWYGYSRFRDYASYSRLERGIFGGSGPKDEVDASFLMGFSILTLFATIACMLVSYYGWDPLPAFLSGQRDAAKAEPSDAPAPASFGHSQKPGASAGSAASGHWHGGTNFLSALLHIGADWLASIVNVVVASVILSEHGNHPSGRGEERTDAIGAIINSGIILTAAIGLLLIFARDYLADRHFRQMPV